MTDCEKPTSMTIGDYCWRLGHDGRYIMQDGYAGDRYQCGVTESLLVERLAKAEQKARWIPVSERLPDRNVNVLVFIPAAAEKTYIASLDDGGMWFSSDPTADAYSLGEDGAPTHWTPLLSLPEAK